MRRPIKPEWLLRLARETAEEGAGPGEQRTTNLRRATSDAYYALFHAIALAVASETLPNASAAEQHACSRYVSHTAVKRVSEWVSGASPPLHLEMVVNRLRAGQSLRAVVSAFLALYEHREAADYDHSAEFTRLGTLAHVRSAEQAVAAIRATTANDDFRALYGLITLQTTTRGG
jgi:uncharacterized protein (UPF0332 family)